MVALKLKVSLFCLKDGLFIMTMHNQNL